MDREIDGKGEKWGVREMGMERNGEERDGDGREMGRERNGEGER